MWVMFTLSIAGPVIFVAVWATGGYIVQGRYIKDGINHRVLGQGASQVDTFFKWINEAPFKWQKST